MQTLDRDEIATTVTAPPGDVYALVADVTRMPEFSPEVVRCRWRDGAPGPAVGARFEAVDEGTRVVASYEVERPVSRLGWLVIEKVFRGGDRREALRAGMRATLGRLRTAAEAGRQAPDGVPGPR